MVMARKQSLRRLLLSHEIALLLLVVVTGLLTGAATYFWQQTSAESVRLNNMSYITEQLRGELFRQIQEVIRARILEDPRAVKLYSEYSRQIGRGFDQLRRNSVSHEEDLAVQGMEKNYREIQRDMNKITTDPYAINYAQRMKILDIQFSQRMVARFENSYQEFKSLLAREHEALEKTRKRWIRLAPVLIPTIIVIAIILVIITRRTLHREFVKPVATVKEGASVMSRGNLQHRIPEEGVTEIAEIAASVNRMAADLETSRDALVQSEKQAALGVLVPVVAHNIRNPLASIRATAQMLEHSTDKNELRESGEAIIETMDRLERWVNALVSYLHPLKPSFRTMKAAVLIDAVQALLRSRLQEKGISVERVNWQEDMEIKVDPDLMEQALSGLLANAIDASPPNSTIRVMFERAPGRFMIRIRDSGQGIPFVPEPGNLEPGPSTKRFGTGLGIPVAFKICQSHGWELKFRTPEQGGTEVTVVVPVNNGEPGQEHEQQ
jgi:signal transduction histidine kinase